MSFLFDKSWFSQAFWVGLKVMGLGSVDCEYTSFILPFVTVMMSSLGPE